jgi:hypothetical protein
MSRRHLLAALVVSAMATSLVSCNSAGTSVTSPVDLSAPQAPSSLQIYRSPRLQMDVLEWSPSASASVLRYDVYVGTSAGGTWTLLGATANASTTEYELPAVGPNTREFYRVRAVGSNNVPSAFTPSFSVIRTDWDGGGTPTLVPGTKGEL